MGNTIRELPKRLPGLHAYRFFAAMLVLFHHIETNKRRNDFDHFFHSPFIGTILKKGGEYGVDFFFVLSGFLITYLLYVEQRHRGTIDVKHFYWRRVVRIWPLYWFLMVVGLVIITSGHIGLWADSYNQLAAESVDHAGLLFGFYAFLSPQLVPAVGVSPPLAISHLWSIGVEEHFYIFMPLLFVSLTRHRFALAVAAFIGLKIAVYGIHVFSDISVLPDVLHPVFTYLRYNRFENMGIGALAAWWVVHRQTNPFDRRVMAVLQTSWAGVILAIGAVIPLCLEMNRFLSFHIFHASIFALLLIHVSFAPKSSVRFEHPILVKGGEVSYGIYMYHPVILIVLLSTMDSLQLQHVWYGQLLIYGFTVVATLWISSLSWKILEKPILKRFRPRFKST